MAMNYEQYQRSSAPEQNSLVNQAQGRIENSLRLSPELINAGSFFRDVYLLGSVGSLEYKPGMYARIRNMGRHERIRGEFVQILRVQDTVGDSKEVLATLDAGRRLGYDTEPPKPPFQKVFQTVFEKLAAKHEQLIAEAELKRRQEELRRQAEARRQAEEARRQREAEAARNKAEAEARRQARNNWPPPESNAGKSPDWVAAQEKIARLWETARQRLPQGIERETQEADIAYFQAGFGLLKEEMSTGAKPLIVRAMLEYLIPQIWRQPRLVENFLKGLEAEQRGRRKPTTLKELVALPKGLFIPLALHNQDSAANKEQSVRIRSGFRTLSKALHTDISNNSPDVNKNLLSYIDLIHKAVNNAWPQVQKNVLNLN